MQTVHIPRSICDEVDKLCRSFLWGDSPTSRKIHAISWKTICMPKDQGGLGLRSMRTVNNSFMMKNGWSLITEPNKLWVKVIRSKYKCQEGAIPRVEKKANMSNLWQGICLNWIHVTPHVKWRVKDGQAARFWFDSWLPQQVPLIHFATTFVPPVELFRKVRDYVTDQGAWKSDQILNWLPWESLNSIEAQTISSPRMRMLWNGETLDESRCSSGRSDLSIPFRPMYLL
uniref:Ribonuclease H protein At1g65750 family n=1 Tax=Cajanus cajan TaxID=3821 RepID=A0A151SNS7_CAJCA|nr:Putative ribonuclease H protein At1g65750 family [Cajanus cajan]